MTSFNPQWFFKVRHLDAKTELTERDLSKDVLSFNVEEEAMNALLVNLQIRDPLGLRAKQLRIGSSMEVSWGVRQDPSLIASLLDNEATSPTERGPMKMFIINNAGILQNKSSITNVSLRIGRYKDRNKITRVFKSGTVRSMLEKVAEELQCNLELRFPDADRQLSLRAPEQQKGETNLAFLKRLSVKLNVKLVYQQSAQLFGKIQTIWMIDWAQEKSISLPKARGGQGLYHYLDYGSSTANMLEGWNWDMNLGGGSFGSSVSSFTDPSTGQTSLRVAPGGTDTTTSYVLDNAKIERELRSRGPAARMELIKEIQGAEFEDFHKKGGLRDRYFRAEKFTTAPEGPGWTMSGDVLPSIHRQVSDLVWMGPKDPQQSTAIPPHFRTRNERQTWRIMKLGLTMLGGGVSQNLEIRR